VPSPSVWSMPSLEERQLAAIAEVRDVSQRLAVEVWLRGGWAADFCLGQVTREHADVDWFAWAGHLPSIADGLQRRGWEQVDEPVDDHVDAQTDPTQRTLVRDGVRMSFAAMAPGSGVTALLTDARVGRIGGQHCLTISSESQQLEHSLRLRA
jgi:Aminoglycoside-2''-adenylyltransferase